MYTLCARFFAMPAGGVGARRASPSPSTQAFGKRRVLCAVTRSPSSRKLRGSGARLVKRFQAQQISLAREQIGQEFMTFGPKAKNAKILSWIEEQRRNKNPGRIF